MMEALEGTLAGNMIKLDNVQRRCNPRKGKCQSIGIDDETFFACYRCNNLI